MGRNRCSAQLLAETSDANHAETPDASKVTIDEQIGVRISNGEDRSAEISVVRRRLVEECPSINDEAQSRAMGLVTLKYRELSIVNRSSTVIELASSLTTQANHMHVQVDVRGNSHRLL